MKDPAAKTPADQLPPRDPNEKTCASCEGKGELSDSSGHKKKCETCEGKGWTLINKNLKKDKDKPKDKKDETGAP